MPPRKCHSALYQIAKQNTHHYGTLNIMPSSTPNIMALSIITLRIMALSIVSFGIMTLSIITFSITQFSIKTLNLKTIKIAIYSYFTRPWWVLTKLLTNILLSKL